MSYFLSFYTGWNQDVLLPIILQIKESEYLTSDYFAQGGIRVLYFLALHTGSKQDMRLSTTSHRVDSKCLAFSA